MNSVLSSMLLSIVYNAHSLSTDLNRKFVQRSVNGIRKRVLEQKATLIVSFCISLIFTYCLFVEKKLVTIKDFLLNFFFFGGGGQNV